MLAVEVELLTGRYTATQYDDRDAPEWPPHPARLFSALVSSWADADEPDVAERAVLEWLEDQAPPSLAFSDMRERKVVTHFVPVNDAGVLRDFSRLYGQVQSAPTSEERQRLLSKATADAATAARVNPQDPVSSVASALRLLPAGRVRHARTYPTVVPDEPLVTFLWSDAEPAPDVRETLDSLLARVSRLGHSSTLVSCRVLDEEVAPRWCPQTRGQAVRVPRKGLLSALEQSFAQHKGVEPRALPASVARYGQVLQEQRPPRPDLAGEWFVFTTDRRRGQRLLSVRDALAVCRAVRDAVISQAEEPVPEVLSGHLPGASGQRTGPTRAPHLAVVPLADVGGAHATGGLLGVALSLPVGCAGSDRTALLTALSRWRDQGAFSLRLGALGLHQLRLAGELEDRWTLNRDRWEGLGTRGAAARTAQTWTSVTPVALDRYPRGARRGRLLEQDADELAAIIALACQRAGLPAPSTVQVFDTSPVTGVPPARSFPAFRSAGGAVVRACVHTQVTFSVPVSGPMLLGAGRHLGYGLCAPLDGPL